MLNALKPLFPTDEKKVVRRDLQGPISELMKYLAICWSLEAVKLLLIHFLQQQAKFVRNNNNHM